MPGVVVERMPNTHVYSAPAGMTVLPPVSCTTARMVAVLEVELTCETLRTLPVRLPLSVQLIRFRLKRVVS